MSKKSKLTVISYLRLLRKRKKKYFMLKVEKNNSLFVKKEKRKGEKKSVREFVFSKKKNLSPSC